MKDLINRPTGIIDITFLNSGKIITIKNEVVDNAKEIIARSLGGDSNYLIDTIEVYYSDTLLASQSTIASFPEIGVVKFSSIFPAASFTGMFNQLILKNSVHGSFSEVIGFTPLTKPESEALSFGWQIKPT